MLTTRLFLAVAVLHTALIIIIYGFPREPLERSQTDIVVAKKLKL